MALTIRAQKLNNYMYKRVNSVFRLKLNDKHYLVSCHENLPIYSVESDSVSINQSDIIVDSKWNDVLILKDKAIFCNSFDKVKQSIITSQTECIIGGYKQKGKYMLEETLFKKFGDVPNYPRIIYYKINLGGDKDNKIIVGDPVITLTNESDELIGMITYITVDNIAYVIPVYYIIKTILRKDNEILWPDIKDFNQITKIDNNKISNGCIWNSHIRMNIPLDVYFLLEGDTEQTFELDNIITEIGFKKYSYDEVLVNDSKIIQIDDWILLTTRTFKFLLQLGKTYHRQIYETVRNRSGKISSIKFKFERNGTITFV